MFSQLPPPIGAKARDEAVVRNPSVQSAAAAAVRSSLGDSPARGCTGDQARRRVGDGSRKADRSGLAVGVTQV